MVAGGLLWFVEVYHIIRPASPQNFPVTQQFRPDEIQRVPYQRLNLSPFTDNSQYGFSANQNQIKGVNTFP
ncbi:hypothetical protein AVEN_110236-1 [Araneus ventricosus]|uniref:Uncharacterized protein n=1 Tax=Araneus ventricosus TaxID=182803 RepID=A0A4Y2QTB0_ARAVE|nr:hypothetical protein AVEN_110236-1 [Araneus ventricosus]